MKNFIFIAFILISTFLLPNISFASCAIEPSIEESAKSASVIFVGTVTKITPAQIATASYLISARIPKWQREFEKVDLVTFSISEAFKGVSSKAIFIATGAEGFAGYKFEGGTWLKEGQTYLVYAYKRELAGTTPEFTDEDYGKEVAAELRAIHKAFPKKLAAEINDFNKNTSSYDANVCGRTKHINSATEELEQIHKMFPEVNPSKTHTDIKKIIDTKSDATFFTSDICELTQFLASQF